MEPVADKEVGSDRQIEDIKERLGAIESRNARVEADKAWETSRFRVLLLTGITYLLTSLVFLAIGAPAPFLSSLIPTLGYYISMQSLPKVKNWWINRREYNDR